MEVSGTADVGFVALNEGSFGAICLPPDADDDGIYDDRDLDSDNDGIPDLVESGGTDADGDGLVNAYDTGATGLAATPGFDADGDGVTDVIVNAIGSTGADAGAGEPLDGRLAAVVDGGTAPDGYDDTAAASAVLFDADGDGVPDYRDLDADNDGILDVYEATCTACPTFGATAPTGDADGDGLDDAFDGLDAANQLGGANLGVTPVATAGSVPDYLDVDADEDLAYDWTDGFDADADGSAVDDIAAQADAYTLANAGTAAASDYDGSADGDGDGVPDFADNSPGTAGYDEAARPPYLTAGSPFFVDRNGNGVADLYDPFADGGAAAPLPQGPASPTDRDWRDAGSSAALPVELLRLDAVADGCSAEVTWAVASESGVAEYHLRASRDGRDFATVAAVAPRGPGSTYAVTRESPAGTTYYQLVELAADGAEAVLGQLAVASACTRDAELALSPNPVRAGAPTAVRTPFASGREVRLLNA